MLQKRTTKLWVAAQDTQGDRAQAVEWELEPLAHRISKFIPSITILNSPDTEPSNATALALTPTQTLRPRDDKVILPWLHLPKLHPPNPHSRD
jgi:hypothetical protein